MKVAIYSPYLDTAGGGEKYVLTIAEYLSHKADVDVLLDDHLSSLNIKEIISKNEKLHGLDLSKVNFISAPIGKGKFIQRSIFLKKYDYLFFNSDGSIFLSTAKNSIVHFQIPIKNSVARGPWGKFKLSSFKKAIYNSKFTKDFIESSWPIKGVIVYPPVNIDLFKLQKKEKQIINVGRFDAFLKVKKHSLLIKNFKDLVDKYNLKDWSLVLAGGADAGAKEYIEELKKEAKGYKIRIINNISLDELIKLYGQSSIYWHAMGFGESDPIKFEHFGITTVEAMASGAVPIVINLGGQKEIVQQGESGFLWNSEPELIDFTMEVIQNQKLMDKLAKGAISRSKIFGKENFCKNIDNLVNKL
jgi:glycosyltransferase involved in cell wall biosynthesis